MGAARRRIKPWRSQAELRRFWALARPLGGTDFVYDVIRNRYGAEKLHEIARAEFLDLMKHMEKSIAAPCKCGTHHGTATCAQYRRIMWLRRKLGWSEDELVAYIRKYAHVDAIRFLTVPKARGIITGLEKIKTTKGGEKDVP